MKDAIQQIGSVAGLASFLGLAVLAFLYFMQARHVRDLEEKATFVPDDVDLPAVATPATGKTAVAATASAERKAGGAAPGNELEAARQVEAARAAAERRKRFQERRGGSPFGNRGPREPGESRERPQARSLIVIGLGALVLAAGVVFGLGVLGGGDKGSTPSNTDPAVSAQGTGPPVEVAVLNGTPVPGLAAKVGEDVRTGGGFKLGAVTNTATPFQETEVMFDQSDPEAQAKAQEVATRLQVTKIEPITGEIKKSAEGAVIVVIVGEDRAGT